MQAMRDISVGPQAPLSLPIYFPSLQKVFPVAGWHVLSGPSSQCGSSPWAPGSSLRAAVLQEAPRPPAANPIAHCALMAGLAASYLPVKKRDSGSESTRSVPPTSSTLQLRNNLLLPPHLPFPSNCFWTDGKLVARYWCALV